MAWALVRSASGIASGTATAAFSSNTAGNLLIVGVESASASAKITISDTAGNTWQTAAITANGGGWRLRLFYAENCKASAGANTVTVVGAATVRIGIAEFSGGATSGSFGSNRSANGNSTSIASGSFTVVSGDLVVAFGFGLSSGVTLGAGFSSAVAPDGTSLLEYQTAGSTSANAAMTCSSGAWTVVAAAFHTSPAPSTAPYVNGDITSSSGSSSEIAVFPSNTSGNVLIAACEFTTASGGVIAVSDSAGNTWKLMGFVNGPSSNYQVAIYMVSSCLGSAGKNTVTVTSTAGGALRMAIAEYQATATTFDAVAYNWVNSATTIQTAIGLPASLNAVVVACSFNVGTAPYGTPSAGYTSRKVIEDGTMFLQDKSSSVSESPGDSTSGASEKSIVAVSIGSGPVNTNLPVPLGVILQGGTSGVAYSESLTTQGGSGPFTYTVTAGALPTGLSLSSGGVISGTPSATGTFSFTVQVTDGNGTVNSQNFQIIIGSTAGGSGESSYAFAG